jgi:hypothetical protein
MRTLYSIVFLLFCFSCFCQDNQASKYGLKIPSQSYLDSLPSEVYKPKATRRIGSFKDLSQDMPFPGDQGINQGSCVAWAVGYGLKTYQERIETSDNNLVFSPSFIFNNFKSTFSSCDEGIFYHEAFDFLLDNGICLWDDMPYVTDNCKIKPSNDAKEDALDYKIEDWKTIYASENYTISDLDEVKSNIFYGRPVAIAVWLDSKIADFMDDFSPNKPKFVWNNPLNDTSKSNYYHAMLCVGYDDATKEFKVLNSYGSDSGNEGYIYISYDAFKKSVYEAYYTIDSNNRNQYVSASKASNQRPEFGITDTSFNYYGWLKKGYFLNVNDNIKVSCVYLKKSNDLVILRLYDTSLEKDKLIGSYKFNSGDVYEIKYQGKKYTLELDKIGSAGYNIFKSAGYINFSSN